MNNLRTIEKVDSGTGEKLSNFDRLIKLYPEILCDSQAVTVINGIINPLGYIINDDYQRHIVGYSLCTPCGSPSDTDSEKDISGGSRCSTCVAECKSDNKAVKRLVPINGNGGNNAIMH